MPLRNLKEALAMEIRDLLNAEQQIARALPRMMESTDNEELKDTLAQHRRQTEVQIQRLEKACRTLGFDPKGVKCEGVEGILNESDRMLADEMDSEVRNAVLIAEAQKLGHYEIASYGTVSTWAEMLEQGEVAQMLRESLEEEKEADQKLTGIAVRMVNPRARDTDT